jgi:ribosome-associated heat shock protein Hsp15
LLSGYRQHNTGNKKCFCLPFFNVFDNAEVLWISSVLLSFFVRFPWIQCKFVFLMEPEDQDLRTGSDFMANRLVFCGSFPDDKAMSEEKAVVSQVRIDKWLWAARFFKTRALAVQAVSGGKVQVNGNRVRSSRIVQIGEILRVRRGEEEFTITVLALSMVRRPAVEARLLYEESEESIRLRQESAKMRTMFAAGQSMPAKRPDKRDRRKIRAFTRKDDADFDNK